MPDTMTLTKIVGSLCGALLIFLFGNWAGEALYSVGGGHGEEEQAYVIDTGTAETAPAEAPTGPSFAAVYAGADPAAGEAVFNQCRACHKVTEKTNGVGPHLDGVVGSQIGSVEDYSYSNALSGLEGRWTPEELDSWLENPADYAPGTKMGFAGISDIQQRANVIAYLQGFEGDPAMAPSAYEEKAAAETADAGAAEGEADAASGQAGTADAGTGDGQTEVAEAEAETSPAEAGSGADEATGEAGGSDFAAMVAAADPAKGKTLFARCAACHSVEKGRNMVGPSLHGVVGRQIASAEGFAYSNAIEGLEGNWTPEKLKEWIANPMQVAPGTRMPPAGVTTDEDIAAIIAYIKSQAPEDEASAGADDGGTQTAAVGGDGAEAPDGAGDATAEGGGNQAAAGDEGGTRTAASDGGAPAGPSGDDTAGGGDGFAAKVAAADPAAGKTVFARCAACHSVEPGRNMVGPSLHGVVGRQIASVEGFNYSNAIKGLAGAWTPAKLKEWIANPMQVAPGTAMPPMGVTAEDDLAGVIAYLDSLDE